MYLQIRGGVCGGGDQQAVRCNTWYEEASPVVSTACGGERCGSNSVSRVEVRFYSVGINCLIVYNIVDYLVYLVLWLNSGDTYDIYQLPFSWYRLLWVFACMSTHVLSTQDM